MTLNITELTQTWQRLHSLAPDAISPITDEDSYDRALAVLSELLQQVGEEPEHPLSDLVEGLVGRVTAYQNAAEHVPPASPEMELRLLMKEKGLTQQALAAATGLHQAQISKLASGKRTFSAEHARRLGTYFGVNPAAFL